MLGAAGNLLLVAPIAVFVPTLVEAEGLGAGALGAFAAAQAVGWVTGAVAAPLTSDKGRANARTAFVSIIVGAALLYPSAFVAANLHALCAVAFAASAALGVFEVQWESYLQQNVDIAAVGRACAIDAWASSAGRTVGLTAAGGQPVR
ncbi:MAG: hypothetical protein FWJ70_03890 [Micromonosporaceae bacterium]|jgi:hypothetical protein